MNSYCLICCKYFSFVLNSLFVDIQLYILYRMDLCRSYLVFGSLKKLDPSATTLWCPLPHCATTLSATTLWYHTVVPSVVPPPTFSFNLGFKLTSRGSEGPVSLLLYWQSYNALLLMSPEYTVHWYSVNTIFYKRLVAFLYIFARFSTRLYRQYTINFFTWNCKCILNLK